MATAYLGLGTNVGNKRGNLVTAAALLAERVGDVLALSDMYETEPWGFESGQHFLERRDRYDDGTFPYGIIRRYPFDRDRDGTYRKK